MSKFSDTHQRVNKYNRAFHWQSGLVCEILSKSVKWNANDKISPVRKHPSLNQQCERLSLASDEYLTAVIHYTFRA